jgi:hypothetical protein
MAHAYTLTVEGQTPISLTSGQYIVTRYSMKSPTVKEHGLPTEDSDYSLHPFSWNAVTDSIELLIKGATIAEVQEGVAALRTALEYGRRRQSTGMGPRVFVTVQWSGETATWRSEILTGRLLLTNVGDQVSRLAVEGVLTVRRRFYWEDNVEVALEMTSSETSSPAETVVLYNDDDATPAATNYIDIAGTELEGSLPTPLRLRITNAEVSALGWQDFYIANTVFNTPASFDPFLLGSEATGGATHAWATNPEEVAFTWTLSTSKLTKLAGRYYRILLACDSASANVFMRPVIVDTLIGLILYKGKQVLASTGDLFDIGSVPIPPGGFDTAGTSVSLSIMVQKIGGGTVICDFVQLTPAGEGLFRKWTQLGYLTENGDSIEDDGPDGSLYLVDASGDHFPIVRGYNRPLVVWPGVQNRLRVLFREGSFTAGRKLNAKAWVRKRRMDIEA